MRVTSHLIEPTLELESVIISISPPHFPDLPIVGVRRSLSIWYGHLGGFNEKDQCSRQQRKR